MCVYPGDSPCVIRQESFSEERGRNKQPSTGATKQVSKKVHFKKSCELCKKHWGAHKTHTTKDCHRYKKDGMVKADFCTTKKTGKKPNPAKQSFAQISKKLDTLEKTLKIASRKSEKRRRDDSNSDSKSEIGSGSTRKLGLNLEETIKRSKFTPPSPIKATPTEITSNQDDARPALISNADDVMLMSSSQGKEVHDIYNTPTTFNPPEGKTTAVIIVMRGIPKDGYNRLCSNKHCKQKIVRVLLDSGSDGDLIIVSKDKPMLLPYSKRLVPPSWKPLNGIFQTRRKAQIELNFFEYSDSRRLYAEPDVVEHNKESHSMTSFLALRP